MYLPGRIAYSIFRMSVRWPIICKFLLKIKGFEQLTKSGLFVRNQGSAPLTWLTSQSGRPGLFI